MQSRRHRRVSELLKRTIGEVILKSFPVEEHGLITIRSVGMSGDLHSAKVFICIPGSKEHKEKLFSSIQQERKQIQAMVAALVKLKYTPQLDFVLDDSMERGDRVIQIIEEIENSSSSA
ncbi:MAG: 30S ribosome-binding factor RbfA [Verrucomicrobia bacterium]|nr:30S ribosome-binding factor RbfA [Verrucomicrobiota bacterium]MCF7709092.1 30S ribosome-binding factor RbfA [Verrucomicrobiota bacterium]